MKIAIIGAGAAGCFAALHIRKFLPQADITLYEGGRKALAKVAVTGGGRCNLTNSFAQVGSLESVYPRGSRLMKRLLREFSHEDAYRWFEQAGIRLMTQDDECVFPVSQNAMEIVDKLLWLLRQSNVKLMTGHRTIRIQPQPSGYELHFAHGARIQADRVLVTIGGTPRLSSCQLFSELNLEISAPVPSLFSLCLKQHPLTQLMGTVVSEVSASIAGTKMKATGPLLITHWGLSGPAILKLSSYGARWLHECGYKTRISVNWFGMQSESEVASILGELAVRHPQKQLQSVFPTRFNSRLWLHLLDYCQMNPTARWAELGRKSYNRMAAMMTNHQLEVDGKNKFKEEFVTCGGVALSQINPSTLECKKHPGLFFAGEVLDVDAITGGFNLQAAWTMGYVAAKAIGKRPI